MCIFNVSCQYVPMYTRSDLYNSNELRLLTPPSRIISIGRVGRLTLLAADKDNSKQKK